MHTETQPIETESTLAVSTTPKASSRTRNLLIATVAAVLVGSLAVGIIPRVRAQSAREIVSQAVVTPTVNVTHASRGLSAVQLLLPGDVFAFEQTRIHARADG